MFATDEIGVPQADSSMQEQTKKAIRIPLPSPKAPARRMAGKVSWQAELWRPTA